jgi:hypothetical protein
VDAVGRPSFCHEAIMVKTYTQLPSKEDWEKDMGFKGKIIPHTRFGSAEAIGELLELLTVPNVTNAMKLEIAGHVWMQTQYILKKIGQINSKRTTYAPLKLGVKKLTDNQLETVIALDKWTFDFLTTMLAPGGASFPEAFREYFGRDVHAHEAAQDQELLRSSHLVWMGRATPKTFKVRFREGRAMRINENDGRLALYDTKDFGDNLEHGGKAGLFVLDTEGHVYCYGKQGGDAELKHSSFLQGERTYAAGMMRWEQGRLIFVTAASGHYKPRTRQMLTVLERLKGYGVPLEGVMVYRINFAPAWLNAWPARRNQPGAGPVDMLEGCLATTLLRARGFPGTHADATCINGDGTPAL